MSNPTPEVEEHIIPSPFGYGQHGIEIVPADFARRLKRERDAAKALLREAERILEEATTRSDFEPRAKPSWHDAARALLVALKEETP